MTDYNQQIADIEAKRAERAAKRAAAADEAKLAKRAAHLQRVDALEDEGLVEGVDFACVDTSCGIVIVKRPHARVYRKFIDRDKHTTAEMLELNKACLAHPDKEEYARWMDLAPGAITRVTNELVKLAEAVEVDDAKK